MLSRHVAIVRIRSNAILLSTAILICGMASNQLAFAALTQKELENKIAEAKVLRPGEKISLSLRGSEVLVHKYRPPESTDTEKDCKIDAVLISKAVMNADESIIKVRTRFFEPKDPSKYSEVLVSISDIKAFAMGALSHAQLLGSLDVTHGVDSSQVQAAATKNAGTGSDTSAPTTAAEGETIGGVVDGPMKEERAKLLAQIKELHDRQINTKAYTEQFLVMEDRAKQGDKSATADILDRLNSAVGSQLKALSMQGKRSSKAGATDATAMMPVDPATGIPVDGETKDRMKDIMYMYTKKIYGNFTPSPGPYESDRSLIAAIMLSKKQQGFDVSKDERIAMNLNALAAKGDKATLSKKIPEIFQYLHITQGQVDEWRKKRSGWNQMKGGW